MRTSARLQHRLVLAALFALVALVAPVAAPAQAAAANPTNVLKTAASLKGIPYVYGGTTTKGFDCSGYTGYVFAKNGHTLPRTSSQQHAAVKHIARGDLRPGDLMFFRDGTRIYHVAIYAGNGDVWHSPRPGKTVSLAHVWTNSWVAGRVA